MDQDLTSKAVSVLLAAKANRSLVFSRTSKLDDSIMACWHGRGVVLDGDSPMDRRWLCEVRRARGIPLMVDESSLEELGRLARLDAAGFAAFAARYEGFLDNDWTDTLSEDNAFAWWPQFMDPPEPGAMTEPKLGVDEVIAEMDAKLGESFDVLPDPGHAPAPKVEAEEDPDAAVLEAGRMFVKAMLAKAGREAKAGKGFSPETTTFLAALIAGGPQSAAAEAKE